jgi:hypothetical protein
MFQNTLCIAALSALLAAPVAGAVELYPVSPDAQRITLTLPEAGAAQTQIQYTGFWHREDYALFQSAQFRAEIIYAAADPYENAALEIPLTFARARDSFDINARGALDLGGIGRLDQPRRTVFYQPYALRDRGWACVAVKSEWNHVGRDPRNRPARAMFGYICDKRGGAMTQARAAELARSIETTGAEVTWDGNGPAISGPVPVGNSGFPFGFGVHFNDHDGDNRDG